MVLYPFPAAGTATLVSQGLLLSFPGLDMPVQRGSGYLEDLTNLSNRVSLVVQILGNTEPSAGEGSGSAPCLSSGSGSSESCLCPLPDQVSLELG